jgi:hypothetical protein
MLKFIRYLVHLVVGFGKPLYIYVHSDIERSVMQLLGDIYTAALISVIYRKDGDLKPAGHFKNLRKLRDHHCSG